MEAELESLFVNFQRGASMQMVLTEMVHSQPLTPAVIEISIGDGFVNNNIHQQHSRATHMQFYWVRDIVRQGQFLVYWMDGENNMAYYFTNHHPTSRYRLKRSIYLVPTVDASKFA